MDRLFISAIFREKKKKTEDEVDKLDGHATSLMRFEFFEVLVRICRVKYIETNMFTKYGPALNHLFFNDMLKYKRI